MASTMQPSVAIVEDDGVLSYMLEEVCSSAGCTVVGCASNARDALQLVADHSPDVLVFDFKIDGDRNGIELLVEAKRQDPDLFTILITGWDINDIAARLGKVMPDRILRKPVRPQLLIDLIEGSHKSVQVSRIAPSIRVPARPAA